mgnify:CR=1 FL=1
MGLFHLRMVSSPQQSTVVRESPLRGICKRMIRWQNPVQMVSVLPFSLSNLFFRSSQPSLAAVVEQHGAVAARGEPDADAREKMEEHTATVN